jgi:hypothetical protein
VRRLRKSLAAAVSEEFAQSGSLQVGAGVSAIVITFGERRPSRNKPGSEHSLSRFPLCFERIELLSQSFFRRFSSVNRAPKRTGRLFTIHGVAPHSPAGKRMRSHSTARRSPAAPPRSAIDKLAPGSETPFPALPPIRSCLGIRGSGKLALRTADVVSLWSPGASSRIESDYEKCC